MPSAPAPDLAGENEGERTDPRLPRSTCLRPQLGHAPFGPNGTALPSAPRGPRCFGPNGAAECSHGWSDAALSVAEPVEDVTENAGRPGRGGGRTPLRIWAADYSTMYFVKRLK